MFSILTFASLVLVGVTVGAARPRVGRGCAGTWTVALQPAPAGLGGLNAVAATSPTDAWSVGSLFVQSDQTGHTLIERHDGTAWHRVKSPNIGTPAGGSLSGVEAPPTTCGPSAASDRARPAACPRSAIGSPAAAPGRSSR